MKKAEGRRRNAGRVIRDLRFLIFEWEAKTLPSRRSKITDQQSPAGFRLLLSAFCLLLSVFCIPSAAQRRPKPALSEGNARRAIAAAPGFALRESAVRVIEVSAAGVAPVTVTAEVTLGVRLASVEDERAAQDGGLFKKKRWRAVEFRTGDRSWEGFDYVAGAVGAERIERARESLEWLMTEYERRQPAGQAAGAGGAQEIVYGPVRLRQVSALGSSAVAEVGIEATFVLERRGRSWAATGFSVGGVTGDRLDLDALWHFADAQKAARARAELEAVRAALERFREERGFYVVADSEVVLMDHLSPSYIARVVRLDPWLRPYRYAGTRESFTLSSDGPDGQQGTPDDVTLNK
jgi:Type II secretion system (T2SS), protein G